MWCAYCMSSFTTRRWHQRTLPTNQTNIRIIATSVNNHSNNHSNCYTLQHSLIPWHHIFYHTQEFITMSPTISWQALEPLLKHLISKSFTLFLDHRSCKKIATTNKLATATGALPTNHDTVKNLLLSFMIQKNLGPQTQILFINTSHVCNDKIFKNRRSNLVS